MAPDASAPVRADAPRRTGRSVFALTVLTLIWAASYADRQLFGIVLPLIKDDLRLSDTSLGLIAGLTFALFYAVLGLPIAWLADRFNRRNILAAGLVLWSEMTALTGAAANLWQLAGARVLVGVGEATGAAPATSMVSDMFGQENRPLTMAVLSSGSSWAALLFLPALGWIAHLYGWRGAFAAAGLAGLTIAAVFVLTVHEPSRRTPDPHLSAIRTASFPKTAGFLLGSRTYLLTVVGGSILGVSLYASQVWHPSFLSRVHHLDIAQVGAAIGVPRGVAGLIGTLLGGLLAERLGRRAPRWRLIVPGVACALALPAELVFLLSPHLAVALCGMLAYHLLVGMHFGPVYATCQSVAPARMRCTATAGFLLVANLVGQTIGPLAVGYLNDQWAAAFGQEAIRYSLVVGSVCALIGGGFMVAAARSLSSDTARAEAEDLGGA
ncbi:MAG: spinster family MFS transporter [Caulobacteraceae bacterium]